MVFHADEDERISKDMVREWQTMAQHCDVKSCEGKHLLLYDSASRASWFEQVVVELEACLR